MPASIARTTNAEHYIWGEHCEGWRLLACSDLSVIQERVPPGAREVGHRHQHARQFFYVLSGVATLEFDEEALSFAAGEGVHVEPGRRHRFVNRSNEDVVFLVISAPTSAGDRIED
jgi:mannose-6-phosphate isomerase-like protein (cupin superfamily)